MSTKDSNSEMLKGALIPSLVVGVIALIISTIFKGSAGLYGALLGQVIVIIFFLVSVGVAFMTKEAEPAVTMALALFSYFAKVLLLGAVIFAINMTTNESQVNRLSFGLTAISLTFAWLAGEVRAFLKLKLHLPLPEK